MEEMRLGFLSNRMKANETPTWDAGSSHQMTDSPKIYGSAEKRHPSLHSAAEGELAKPNESTHSFAVKLESALVETTLHLQIANTRSTHAREIFHRSVSGNSKTLPTP